MNQVLFLCNRNICTSRIAAALFNQVARGDYLFNGSGVLPLSGWRAISRGLKVESPNQLPISKLAVRYLNAHGIEAAPDKLPQAAEPSDLLWSDRIIALDESEQGAIIDSRFSFWSNRIEFWDVPDFYNSWDDNRLAKLEANVLELVSVIRAAERVASH